MGNVDRVIHPSKYLSNCYVSGTYQAGEKTENRKQKSQKFLPPWDSHLRGF